MRLMSKISFRLINADLLDVKSHRDAIHSSRIAVRAAHASFKVLRRDYRMAMESKYFSEINLSERLNLIPFFEHHSIDQTRAAHGEGHFPYLPMQNKAEQYRGRFSIVALSA
jgi:hypothetical protein